MERTENTPEVLDATEQTFIVREVPAAKKILKRRIGFFTGDERHEITLEEGMEYTRNYRKSSKKYGVLATYFGKDIFEKILDQKTCVGIRIYYAKREDGTPTLVLTGAQTNNDDLYQGILAQEARLSLDLSPRPNQLNSDSWKKAVTAKRSAKLFSGQENHYVTLAEASQLTRTYRESIEDGDVKGAFFGSGIFRKILAQDGCVGIHIYHGIHNDGSPTFVLVGINEYGYDLVAGTIGQMAFYCPPWCYVFGPLNK
jgi:hypothetical protein